MRIFNALVSKAEVWAEIVKDLGIHSPLEADGEPKKQHTSGRRESRVIPRACAGDAYIQTPRGYWVKA